MKLSKGDKILMLIGLTIILTMGLLYLSIYATNPWMKPVISFGWVEITYLITIGIFSTSLLATVYCVRWYLRKLKNTMKDAIKEGIVEAEKEKVKEKR